MRSEPEILGCEPRLSADRQETLTRRSRGLGALLVLAGTVWGVQIGWNASIRRYWPIAVVVAGVFLWILAVFVRPPGQHWLAILGSSVLTTGLILTYQVRLTRWESWWYAWPLIIPLSIGMAVVVGSRLEEGPREAWRTGIRWTIAGGLLWTFLFLLFEGVIGVAEPNLDIYRRWPLLLPLALAVGGAGLLLWPRDQDRRFKPS